jgi:NAD(P)H-nitrite reductase large subunit
MRVVIIGAGPAGLTVAETLRRHDRVLDVTMLSTEPFPPYAPPAMADHFLTGREETLYWKGRDVCDRLALDYRSGVGVSALDGQAKRLTLDDGSSLTYDRLVIASGSRLYAPVAGAELPGVSNFKSLGAASDLVARARRGEAKRAVIVGAGFIGVEVALVLRDLGLAVTMIEALDRVMPRMLDPETAEIVAAELRRRGIDLWLGARAKEFVGSERVEAVELESGHVARADIFVAATGVKPNVEFLQGSGVDQKWGIVVDDRLRATVPDVYAAGDVAETVDRMTGERYVHAIFPNAVAQAEVVAFNLLGHDVRYEGAESMNSLKHVGLPVMAVGAQDGQETLRYRDGGALRKIFLTDGRIVGFRLTGDARAAGVYRSLMLRHADVSAFGPKLTDPSFGVADLVLAPPGLVD